MTIVQARATARRARELLVSVLGAVLLLFALVMPALGAPPGPTKLESPVVSPRTTDSATPITFTVTYRSPKDLPPEYVRVAVAGTTYSMSGAGTDWKAGVVFTVATTLPAGTHAVRFEARDAERFPDQVDAGTVAVDQAPPPTAPPPTAPLPTAPPPTPPPPTAPPPTPPPPTAPPSPTPTDLPSLTSAPEPTPTAPLSGGAGPTTGSGGPTGGSTGGSGSGARDGPGGSVAGTDSASTGSTSGTGANGAGPASDVPEGAAGAIGMALPWWVTPDQPGANGDPGDASGGSTLTDRRGGSAGGLTSWLDGSFGGGLAALGLAGPGHLPTFPAVFGSTIAVATWMAFTLFARRRRDGEPVAPDDVLHAAAGTGVGVAIAPLPPYALPVDPESLMPRWRRPSLIEARKTDPIRSPGAERQRLAFAHGFADGVTEVERRKVRYAVAPLLDRPDEIQASRIGELAAGDEVQVQKRSGAYCLVLCPDGREGWIHRMTLGDVVPPQFHAMGGADSRGIEPEAENALAALLAARGLR